jgi:hypothetical protein
VTRDGHLVIALAAHRKNVAVRFKELGSLVNKRLEVGAGAVANILGTNLSRIGPTIVLALHGVKEVAVVQHDRAAIFRLVEVLLKQLSIAVSRIEVYVRHEQKQLITLCAYWELDPVQVPPELFNRPSIHTHTPG